MKHSEGDQLFDAVRKALSQRLPELDHAGVRRRVLEAHATHRRGRDRRRGYRLALAFTGIAVVAALFVVLGLPAPTTFQVAGQDGQVGAWLEARASQELPLSFSEGSRVSLTAGSRGRVRRLSTGGAGIELGRGTVSADVMHRSGADWTFEAGPFEIAVLGTRLDVSWVPERGQFELRVAHGAVRVRGPLLQGGQEVRAGQVCRVDLARDLMEIGSATGQMAAKLPASGAVPPAVPSIAVPRIASPGASAEPAKPSWAALAQAGNHREAVAAAERTGLSGIYRAAGPESLLDLARAARLAGRPDLERAALLACRQRAPGHPAAAQAAYLLGRASPAGEAATWFEVYLRDQPRGLLAREASGRLIESYLAAGNRAAAERAARGYLAAYPAGPHVSMARRVLASPKTGE